MTKKNKTIHIIGAGISGLTAAVVLEKNGFKPIIIEASNRVGGRVKTDVVDGYQLDHGFQVLLTSYPFAKKYLDYNSLKLQRLLPGAIIFKNRKSSLIGDPLRKKYFLWSTLFSNIISTGDKLKILRLNKVLKKKSIDEIFNESEIPTISYLYKLGFTSKTINNFFIPFFSGIFLENELVTSSSMFQFVYKMFGHGYAAIPTLGVEEISKQLKNKLKHTQFLFNSEVKNIDKNEILLSSGQVIQSEFVILATTPLRLVNTLHNTNISWKSCQTLYFKVDQRVIEKPIIGLVADNDALINNLFFHSSIIAKEENNKELLSVTIIKGHDLDNNFLVKRVIDELEKYCNILNPEFIKMYHISKALPENKSVKNRLSTKEICINDHLFLAGDHLLNGSLNAAMYSGELAAKAIIEKTK